MMSNMNHEEKAAAYEAKAKDLDHVSTIFGIFDINFNETVTLFEGPLDSFLFRNSTGMCSIKTCW